jgi:hypothetical protein
MRQTPHAINELRARALALGIVWEELPPLLRIRDIVRGPKGARGPPGILPISERTFYSWVANGLIPPPIKFESGISAWPREVIVRIALDGIRRPRGMGASSPAQQKFRPQHNLDRRPAAGTAGSRRLKGSWNYS